MNQLHLRRNLRFFKYTVGIFWIPVCWYLLVATSPICLGQEITAEQRELVSLSSKVVELYRAGSYEKASEMAVKALRLSEEIHGVDHPDTANSLNNLAVMYEAQGRYEEAVTQLRRSLEINEKNLGVEGPETATALNNLGALYVTLGSYAEAETLYLRSLHIREKSLGSEDPATAACLNSLAGLYRTLGRYAEAEPLCRRSLEIYENKLGDEDPETATSLNNLAGVYEAQGRYEEAEPLFRRSLEIFEKQLGLRHSTTAICLRGLAGLYQTQGRYDEAESLYRRSLEIFEETLGAEHPNTATSLDRLARLSEIQLRYEEAELLYRRSLEIREKCLGPEHPNTAFSLSNLAGLFQDEGRYAEAEPLYLRSLAISETRLGLGDPRTAVSLDNLAALYQKQGLYEASEPFVERSLIGSVNHWAMQLAYFSERENLAFQGMQTPFLGPGNQGSGRLCAEAQLYFKGAVLEAMNARRRVEIALNNTEEGRQLLKTRESFRSRYQHAFLAKGGLDEEVKDLQAKLDDLDKQSSALLGRGGTSTKLMSVGLKKVQEALPEGAALVESFRYDHQLANKRAESRYASTFISRGSEPAFISHGTGKSIEDAVKRYRDMLQHIGQVAVEAGEFVATESFLYTALLSPLEEHLSLGQMIIFSPDAQLHFLPLGLLRDTSGRAFAEKYEVRYVTSGRDLVKPRVAPMSGQPSALVLGNPSFRDNSPMVALAEATELKLDGALPASTDFQDETQTELLQSLRSSLELDGKGVQFRALPGTAREAAQVADKLRGAGYSVESLSGNEASETEVMRNLEGHVVVHLATHGFFLDELNVGTKTHQLLLSNTDERLASPPSQNPMYRSGLALSGAQSTFNLWKGGQVPPTSRDGVLLAAELVGVDLSGTDLVVLSACETAAGELLDGEGVVGLRRSLNAAGATNVVMTLWAVDDAATVELMDVFYGKYLSGVPAAKALVETQRELLPKWVERDGEVKALARLAPFICTSVGQVE